MGMYAINVAEANGVGWNGETKYKWFCTIEAGDSQAHAQRVAETVAKAFPVPDYSILLQKRDSSVSIVEKF